MSAPLTPAFDPASPDALILDAFEKVRHDRAAYYAALTDAEYEAVGLGDDKLVALESIVSDTPAQTIEGVIAQLLLAIPSTDTVRWVDESLARWGLPGLLAISAEGNDRCSWPTQGIANAAAALVRVAWKQAVARYERDHEIFDYFIEGSDRVIVLGGETQALEEYFETAQNRFSDDKAIRLLITTLAPGINELRMKAELAMREGLGDEALPWLARDVEYLASPMLALRSLRDAEAANASPAE